MKTKKTVLRQKCRPLKVLPSRLKQGFSLVELIIAMAIISVLVGLLAPNLNEAMKRQQLRQATQGVTSMVKTAGNYALSNGRNVSVHFGVDQKTNQHTVSWYQGTQAVKKNLLKQTLLPKNIKVRAENDKGMVFTGRGLPLSQYSFDMKNKNNIQKVTLLPSGLILTQ